MPVLNRLDSIVPTPGREGESLAPRSHTGKCLAVFTSGGDSQGMNSAVRSVVRMGMYLGCRVYCIHEGYQGMVDGGHYIVEADWNSVSDIIQRGGTIIGSARCKDFRTREGRKRACENLLKHNITNLVCIGGDGSLTGANQFRLDWPGLLKELVAEKRVSQGKANMCANINIVGLVGSIDNDFCGTDMTIGTDSALHRIVEAVDAVVSTAQSHQRCFVVEVMGRHCGYLALVAGLATEADWIFMPEWPPESNWAETMCDKLAYMRDQGQRLNIVIVSEGAIDRSGNSITAVQVKNEIKTRLKYDTRVTVLGHVQRGGHPSAFDRLLGCRMGAEAVIALVEMTSDSAPCVISTDGNQMVRVPLMQCVTKTQAVQKAMDEKDFERAVKLRGHSFQRNLATYKILARVRTPESPKTDLSGGYALNIAIMNVGAPAAGMNAVVRAFVRIGLCNGCTVYGVHDSFEGLAKGKMEELSWTGVANWVMYGGSFLGTQKQLPEGKLQAVAKQMERKKIHALFICGGFEAYHSALQLYAARSEFPAFCIPITVVPCVISNNVPGTSLSLGSDTALNEICKIIDKIKQSATGTKRRVFVVEVMGGHCGYLATVSALASGADNAYIFEENFNVEDIKEDCQVIADKMEKGVQRYLIIRNECANNNYTTEFIRQLFSEEGKGKFTTRVNVLGHVQQGGSPSPFDRNQATKLSIKATEHLIAQARDNFDKSSGVVNVHSKESATLLGLVGRYLKFTPVEELESVTNFKDRLPTDQWWMRLRALLRILAKHDSTYTSDADNAEAAEAF